MYNNLYNLADRLNIKIDFTDTLVMQSIRVVDRTIYVDKFDFDGYFTYNTRLSLAAGIAHILLKREDRSYLGLNDYDYELRLLMHNMLLHTNQIKLYKLNRDSWVKPENVAKTFEVPRALVELKMDLVGYEY